MALASVILLTIREISTRKLDSEIPTITVAFSTTLGITVFAALPLIGSEWVEVHITSWLLIIVAAAAITVATLLGIVAMRTGDISFVSPFRYTSLIGALGLGVLFFGEADKVSLDIWEANIAAHEYGISLLKPNISCAEVTQKINKFFEDRGLLQYRTFGYGHSFGVLSHYYGREAGLELREDIDTILKPGMVISMEPMLTIPNSQPGAGGYREHDILIIMENGNENITKYPYGPDFNVIA